MLQQKRAVDGVQVSQRDHCDVAIICMRAGRAKMARAHCPHHLDLLGYMTSTLYTCAGGAGFMLALLGHSGAGFTAEVLCVAPGFTAAAPPSPELNPMDLLEPRCRPIQYSERTLDTFPNSRLSIEAFGRPTMTGIRRSRSHNSIGMNRTVLRCVDSRLTHLCFACACVDPLCASP